MESKQIWKWLILIAVLSISIALLRNGVPLGLDLKGGTSFVVEIDEQQVIEDLKNSPENLSADEIRQRVNTIMENAQERSLQVLRNRIDALGIAEPNIYPVKDNRIVIQLPGIDEKKREATEQNIKSAAFLEFRLVHDKNDRLVRELADKKLAPEGYKMVWVGDTMYYQRDASYAEVSKDPAYRYRLGKFQVPDPEYEFMLEYVVKNKQELYRPYFVKRRRELTGTYLRRASVDYELTGPIVRLQFNAQGARKFANITTDNVGRQLAIVLDGTLYSAPVIRQPIEGGNAQIEGNFDIEEANRLRDILNAGSLPAPVKIIQRQIVSPTLGSDSIRSGIRASIIAGVVVVVFMITYYSFAGIVADMALIMNLLLLPLGMVVTSGFLGVLIRETGRNPGQLPVLTLPGIAGIALTFGMAVDANVLIFERIREESNVGKRIWSAITAGYERAFPAILDSNLTTIFTGIIMFFLGSGPIRGYAITLSAGIIVSMYTALTVTKMIFGLWANKPDVGRLKMCSLIGKTNIDFVRMRSYTTILSLAVIIVSWVILGLRATNNPKSVFGVEFTGGVSLTFRVKEEVPVEQLRKTLTDAGIREMNIQYGSSLAESAGKTLLIRTSTDTVKGQKISDVIINTLTTSYKDAGFELLGAEDIGPQIGSELKSKALWAMFWSLVGMVIYISARFKLSFAVAAILALLHDVLVTVGIYALCGKQFNSTTVAAMLTIIGYSVNDTIIVFDRIRENLRLNKIAKFDEIANISINQTLSRTFLTSGTTLISITVLLLLGGRGLNDFAFTLFIGVITGTYSSILVATPIVLWWHKGKRPDTAIK